MRLLSSIGTIYYTEYNYWSMLNALHARLVPQREHSLSYTGVLFTYSHQGIMCMRIGTEHCTKNKIGTVRWATPFWRFHITMVTNEFC
jgi:hypothetical protein